MAAHRRRLLLRWTWRDLRQHWIAVLAIASILAIGTGVFAGLGSTATWRTLSNDASFAALDMHDLRVVLSPGTFASEGELSGIVGSIEHAEEITGVAERLRFGTQVDASTADETILVPGRVIGLDPATGPDRLWVAEGSGPEPGTAVLEVKFANTFDLPVEGEVELAGGTTLRYVGLGDLPTDFYVAGERGDLLAQFNFAALYTDLPTAQELAGRPAAVNDVVVTIAPDADRETIELELHEAFDAATGLSAIVTDRDEDEAFRILYEDIDNDQKFWNVLSALILVSAALAAFNLISRIVEAQRRQIGIGMAIGASPRRLAIRPLLTGLQIGVLGAGLGVLVGLAVGEGMRRLLADLAPLPDWRTPFQVGTYARAALLALAVPVIGAAIPVWRAVRVEPIQAIRTGHLAARRTPRTLRRIRLPGSSIDQLPLRNVLRTPRRTALTALGVAASITALVAVLGMLDSFDRTLDIADAETTQDHPNRLTATLDTFRPHDDPAITTIDDLRGVTSVDLGIQVPATISAGNREIDVLLEAIDFAGAAWTPTLDPAVAVGVDQIVLAQTAADDLGVGVGDVVELVHPERFPGRGFGLRTTEHVVAATHPNPLRVFAFVDRSTTDAAGFAGLANVAQVLPADGSQEAVQRALFESAAVASANPATRIGDVFDDALEQFRGFLVIAQVAVLALATLIAFNSTRISIEERTREHATMLAFGTRVRTVLGLVVKEGVLVGALATLVGVGAGYAMLSWLVNQLFAQTLPDLGVVTHVSARTLLISLVIGVLAVALAPLLMVRRLTRMNLPDTLRVME